MELNDLEEEINKILIDCDSPFSFYHRAAIMGIMLKIKQYDMAKTQLPEEYINELKSLAKEDNKTLSNYVDNIIKDHIETKTNIKFE